MSVDTNNTELKKGADLATIADQRDDQGTDQRRG